MVPTTSEEFDALVLRGGIEEAFARARKFDAEARSGGNALLRCEAQVILAECTFLRSEPGHAAALAGPARKDCDAHGFRPLSLRARLVEALCLVTEHRDEGGRALALLAHEIHASRLPLTRARVGLLRVRLGLCEGAENEVAHAWATLLTERASCRKAQLLLSRLGRIPGSAPRGLHRFRLISVTVDPDEGAIPNWQESPSTPSAPSTPTPPSASSTTPSHASSVAENDVEALRALSAARARVWFPGARLLLIQDPQSSSSTLLDARSDSLSDSMLATLLDAGPRGRRLEELHALRSKVGFRPEDHAPALHVALARLRIRIAPFGLAVARDRRTGTYAVAFDGLFLRYLAVVDAHRPGCGDGADGGGGGGRTAPRVANPGIAPKRKAEILALLEIRGVLSCSDLGDAMGLTRQSLRPYLAALEDEGRIVRWGKGPGTRYAAR